MGSDSNPQDKLKADEWKFSRRMNESIMVPRSSHKQVINKDSRSWVHPIYESRRSRMNKVDASAQWHPPQVLRSQEDGERKTNRRV